MTKEIAAGYVMDALRKKGFEAFLVGGCVRDLLLGKEPKDYDVTTNARPEQVMELFVNEAEAPLPELSDKYHWPPRPFGDHDVKTIPVGAAFGVVTVAIDGIPTEVATYRADGDYADGRHPDVVFYADSAREDVSRRDFTINGLLSLGAIYPSSLVREGTGAYVGTGPVAVRDKHYHIQDHVGGLDDLKGKIIRCIGDPDKRFGEDALRMLRACRFAAQLGFEVEEGTKEAIRRNAPAIGKVSMERIAAEILRLVSSPHPMKGLVPLIATGLVDHIPLLDRVIYGAGLSLIFRHFHAHPTDDPATGMAILTQTASGEDAARLLRGLKLSNGLQDEINGIKLVRGTMRGMYDHDDPPYFKRLMRTPGAAKAVALLEQDVEMGHECLRAKVAYLKSLKPEDINPPRLVTGDDLLAMGMAAGPGFGVILRAVEEGQLAGTLRGRNEALEYARKMASKGQSTEGKEA